MNQELQALNKITGNVDRWLATVDEPAARQRILLYLANWLSVQLDEAQRPPASVTPISAAPAAAGDAAQRAADYVAAAEQLPPSQDY